jgi:hypothetical protein
MLKEEQKCHTPNLRYSCKHLHVTMEISVISQSLSSCIETEILVLYSGTDSSGRLLDYLILCVLVARRWIKFAPLAVTYLPFSSPRLRTQVKLKGFSWKANFTVFHEVQAERFFMKGKLKDIFMKGKLDGFSWRASWWVFHEGRPERGFVNRKLNCLSWRTSWTVFHEEQAEWFFVKGKLDGFSWKAIWTVLSDTELVEYF